MKSILAIVVFSCGLLLTGCASTSATDSSASAQVAAERTVGEYRAFLNELDTDIEAGVPRELSSSEKNQYQDLSETMHQILDSHESDAHISGEARQTFLNVHESIQTVVMGSQEGEVVCRGGESTTGSNMRNRRCTTRNQPTEQQREVMRYFEQGLE